MAFKFVEAVVFWRYSAAPAQAAYGRPSGEGNFTKNYLQVSGEPQAVLDRVLGRSGDDEVQVTWKWPGDELVATWKEKTTPGDDRGELYIRRRSDGPTKTVRPFQLGDPSADSAITFSGTGNLTESPQAQMAVDTFLQHHRGWILAIKLAGEERILHARAYLDAASATPGRSLDDLPEPLRDAIRKLPANKGAGVVQFGPSDRSDVLADRIRAILEQEPNVLLVGPPGTGKTVSLEALASNFLTEANPEFDPDTWKDNWRPPSKERRVVSIVFHPSYTYERFVGGLVPKVGKSFELAVRPGPLLNLAHWIGQSGREALLIIDEFNRGSPAAIFGDTLALLDGSKRSEPWQFGTSIQRPYAGHAVSVDKSFADVRGGTAVADELRLPTGLKIVAAMNSSDRSIAPLDAAMRRRFHVLNVPPDYEALASRLGVPLPNGQTAFAAATRPAATWTTADVGELAVRLLMTINGRIASLLGPDFLLGPALLWNIGGENVGDWATSLAVQFEARVLSSLRMTFLEQDELLAAILRIDAGPTSALAVLKQPEANLSAYATPRLVWNELGPDIDWEIQLAALTRVAIG